MKKKLIALSGLFVGASALAGTIAGTTISNQASVEYSVGVSPDKTTTQSNVSTFIVNELIDVQLTWIDASEIIVNSPDTKKVLTFRLTNTGNGNQKYTLNANNNIGGGNFSPIINGTYIYVENGLSTGLQVGGAYKDKEYTTNDVIEVAPGEYKNVYLVYDIPSGLVVSSKGFSQLDVASTISEVQSAQNAGTIFEGVQSGLNTIDVILGYTLGKAQATGNYIVAGLMVSHEKSVVSVKDITGGSLITSGSEVLYQIKVEIKGVGIAKNLVISDTLPSEMTYVPNSMILNGASISDSNITGSVINVVLGDQTPTQTFVLQFKTKIN